MTKNLTFEAAELALYSGVVDVLQIDAARPKDNFIELGGNSLLATILANRIEDEYRVRLDVRDIFSLDLDQLAWLFHAAVSNGTSTCSSMRGDFAGD
ncbi:MAG: acyl carrier protein [Thermoanaerobaculia bacterium]